MYQLQFPLWIVKRESRLKVPQYLVNHQGQLLAFTGRSTAAIAARTCPGSELIMVSKDNHEVVLAELCSIGQLAICCDPNSRQLSGTYFSIHELALAAG